MTAPPAFGVIVPVRDEAASLPTLVPRMLDGLGFADLVFVCNGCADDSAAVLRALVGSRARVLELPEAGKAAAIRAGEAASPVFPRVYLDADVGISGAALNSIAARLAQGDCDLVAPRLRADTRGAGRLARWITETWMETAHMRLEGFHCVLGISAGGRSRWGRFPDVINDDDFITRRIPPDRRCIMADTTAVIRPPLTFRSWVLVRERWLRGQRQLGQRELGRPELGAASPLLRTKGQLGGLAATAVGGHAPRVLVYLAARALAALLVSRSARRGQWYRDATSRDRPPIETPD